MKKKSLSTHLMLALGAAIILMSFVNIVWGTWQYRTQAEVEMKEKAVVIAQQLLATRAFIAEKQDVINYNAAGEFEFKHMNPAAVGTGVGHIFSSYTGYLLKQTRLGARAPANAPDEYERARLARFAANPGIADSWGYDEQASGRVFRYMMPLYYTADCLACHGEPAGELDVAGYVKEGAQVGDFAGALSIMFSTESVDAALRDNVLRQIIYMAFVMLIVILGIRYLTALIVTRPLHKLTEQTRALGGGEWTATEVLPDSYDEIRELSESFRRMTMNLRDLYADLENKVEQRTLQLREANLCLENQQQKLLALNERLSESDRLKSEFLAVMSHELRTPLTTIIAFTETLLTEGDLTELQNDYLRDISGSACELDNHIGDILDMSKIEAGMSRLNLSVFSLSEAVREWVERVQPLFARKKIHLTCAVDALPPVTADREKLGHVLQNLLSNALKYTPAGGLVTVDGALEGGEVRIAVSDNGAGIAEKDTPFIFDKFRQGAEHKAGAGLGLAIVKSFVQMHGGTVSVRRQPQGGMVFSLFLPLTEKGGDFR
jgi:signal transduction histidine kinase